MYYNWKINIDIFLLYYINLDKEKKLKRQLKLIEINIFLGKTLGKLVIKKNIDINE